MNGTGVMTLLGFSASEILGVLQSLAILAGGLWVLITFRNNNRIKSIETLISLETEYRRHIDTLLEIECDYDAKIRPLLVEERNNALSSQSREKLNALDEALRHFTICAQVRNLGVDGGLLDMTYRYYLSQLYSGMKPELKAYIDTYWPTVREWAQAVSRPRRPVWKRLLGRGS